MHGVGGVSFRDIATRIGIKSASVHHHFPSKDDLILALVRTQRAETEAALAALREIDPFRHRLEAFAGLFRQHLVNGNRFCLCGMMGAEVADLPDAARMELVAFFDMCGVWLEREIAAHAEGGALGAGASPETLARLFVATLEGAMLIARVRRDLAHFDTVVDLLVGTLATPLHG